TDRSRCAPRTAPTSAAPHGGCPARSSSSWSTRSLRISRRRAVCSNGRTPPPELADQSTVVARVERCPSEGVAGPVVADPEGWQPGPPARPGWLRTDRGRDEAEHLHPA